MPGFKYRRRGFEILERAAAMPGLGLAAAARLADVVTASQVENDFS
jgi:hypothetical protein